MSGTSIALQRSRSTSTYICGVLRTKRAVQADQSGLFVAGGGEIVGGLLQGIEAQIADVADHDLEAAGVAQPIDCRSAEHRHRCFLHFAVTGGAKFGRDGVGAEVAAVAMLKFVEDDVNRSVVRADGILHE